MRRFDIEVNTAAYPTELDGRTVDGSPRYGLQLQYRLDDPYAVRLVFDEGRGRRKIWTVGRDLMASGLEGRCGDGVVRVWPHPSPDPGFTAVAIAGDGGSATYLVPSTALRSFLHRTFLAVPAGKESGRVNWDAVAARLLQAGAS